MKEEKKAVVLCDLVKKGYLKEKTNDYMKLIRGAQYGCRKCGRAAAEKKRICKPEDLGD